MQTMSDTKTESALALTLPSSDWSNWTQVLAKLNYFVVIFLSIVVNNSKHSMLLILFLIQCTSLRSSNAMSFIIFADNAPKTWSHFNWISDWSQQRQLCVMYGLSCRQAIIWMNLFCHEFFKRHPIRDLKIRQSFIGLNDFKWLQLSCH